MTAAPKRLEAVPEPAEDKAPPAATPVAPAVAAPAGAIEAAAGAKRRGKMRSRLLMVSVPLALALAGGYVWLTGGRYVSTDNAYVHQQIMSLSTELTGRLKEVDVAENQQVKAGDVLFRIDPTPFQITLDQADAALAAARLNVQQLRAAYTTAVSHLNAAQTILAVQTREYTRQKDLTARGVSSSSALDDATQSMQEAQNAVDLARDGVTSAAAALGGDPKVETDAVPVVQQALAAREEAAWNLAQTVIRAPADGVVSQVDNLNVGQLVSASTAVASLVITDDTTIEANFKETQLDGIKVGQPVDIEVDAYPGATLHGKVQSIGQATGSEFSLIPAQNATGNWVKVVQRLAVRIKVDGDDAHPLRDGMSTTVAVDTGKSRLDALR